MPVKTAEEYAEWQHLKLRRYEAARMKAYAFYVVDELFGELADNVIRRSRKITLDFTERTKQK